jgi:hypothetical protein
VNDVSWKSERPTRKLPTSAETQVLCNQRLPALSHFGHFLLGFAAEQPIDRLGQEPGATVLHLVWTISILGHVFAGA